MNSLCNKILQTIWLLCLLASPGGANAASKELLDTYELIKAKLEQNIYGVPVYIESHDENNIMLGKVYGVIDHTFEKIHDALLIPGYWCEITPQHLNIKACTYHLRDGYCELTFYSGRKFYETPEDVYQLVYRFDKIRDEENYFHISLTAAKGPIGTGDYHIDVEAVPLADNKTFIHFRYSYTYNFFTRMGMNTYLATLGSGKKGFSILGKDETGKPVYIEGIRGIIERNAIRYYLAIQSYLDTLDMPTNKKFNARINRWYDLTDKYHSQLYEMEKNDYIKYKQQERKDQIRLQEIVNKKIPANNQCNQK